MAGKHRTTNRAKAGDEDRTGRRRAHRRPLDASAWLGAGAVTVGLGAALANGTGLAHADSARGGATTPSTSTSSTGSAPSPGSTVGTTSRTSPGTAKGGPSGGGAASPGSTVSSGGVSARITASTGSSRTTTGSRGRPESTNRPAGTTSATTIAITTAGTDLSTLKHVPTVSPGITGTSPATSTGAAATISPPTQPALTLALGPTALHPGALVTAAALGAGTQSASAATLTTPSLPTPALTAALLPAPGVPVSPFEGVANLVAKVLLAVGGMNPANPMPNPANPVQLLLFSLAAGLEKTFDPAPKAGTPTMSAADPTTGTITGSLGFATDPSGDLTFTAPASSTGGGTVTVYPDGSYSYTPTSAQRQAATTTPTDTFAATVHDGLSSNAVTVTVPVTPPQVTATIAVGTTRSRWRSAPTAATLYVTNEGGNSVSVIDTATNTVTATIPVGSRPDRGGGQPRRHPRSTSPTRPATRCR